MQCSTITGENGVLGANASRLAEIFFGEIHGARARPEENDTQCRTRREKNLRTHPADIYGGEGVSSF